MLNTQEALVITMTSAPADVSIYEVYPWTSSLNAKLILGSLLDTFYNHLKFSMFKTQLIISTFPSVFSFFFHLCVLLWSTSLPTPTPSTYPCTSLYPDQRLMSHQWPFPQSHIYLFGDYLLSFLLQKSVLNYLPFSLSLLCHLSSRLIISFLDYYSGLLT